MQSVGYMRGTKAIDFKLTRRREKIPQYVAATEGEKHTQDNIFIIITVEEMMRTTTTTRAIYQ